jgi:hypothetical protein
LRRRKRANSIPKGGGENAQNGRQIENEVFEEFLRENPFPIFSLFELILMKMVCQIHLRI